MRNLQRCSKCKHNHILVIANVADRGAQADNSLSTHIFSSTTKTNIHEHIDAWRIAAAPDTARGGLASYGLVSAYICRACGFTEFYTLAPETIPVDGVWIREVVGPEPEGPFR